MKKLKHLILTALACCAGAWYNHSQAQATACPSVNAGPDQVVCGGCATLTGSVQGTVTTSSYSVANIPYQPFSYNTGTQVLLGIDDFYSDTVVLPFCFEYFGQTYTRVVIGSNGVVNFDPTSNANNYNTWPISAPVPDPTVPDLLNSIMGPWHDIDPSVGGSIYYALYGTAPCRQLVVSWYQVPMFSCNNLIDQQQIVLYETTNVIDVFIQNKPVCSSWNGGAAIEAIQDQTGTTAVVVPGRNFPTQWTAANDGVRFTPTGTPNYTFAWFDASTMQNIGTSPSIQVCPTTTTSYIAQVTNQTCNGTITVTDTVTVTIGTGNVSVTASSGTPSCSPNSGTATANASGNGPFTYSWIPGGQTTQTATGLSPGTYTVVVTNQGGCQATDTVLVQAGVPINLTMNGTNTICPGQSTMLTSSVSGGTPGFTYSWAPNGGSGSTALVSPTATTTYTVYVTDAAGCTASASGVTVTVGIAPTGAFTFTPPSTFPNQPVVFTDQSTINPGNITGWFWSFGDGDTSALQNPTHAYANPGTYNVCLVVYSNQSSCPDSICFTYVVEPTDVIVPNVITPNGDGRNDSLIFKNLEFYPNSDLKIYNRWGGQVYASTNYMNDWQGDNLSDGTYFFVLSIPGLEDGVKRGFIEILRNK